ncbi:uncharacterized protein Pyn_08228 [Prunus yedoensis var. nudiflora]|uniref:DUF2828 domain-containing protein n=1 Tax=Prunus yedoensis var. nudiflora TaxID=2094558 RepID=A0A314XLS8_PRUYE|nr:uncharacterized protein Pyn_06223 [Prunus yedoensis var. nudiflora]PQQ11809.1 uncharacterized protein Pyn_08228 [Prunus yedoensis var. nudiflora]
MAKIVSSIVKANKNYVKKSISRLSTRLTLIAAAPYATLVAPPLNPIPIPLIRGFSALTRSHEILDSYYYSRDYKIPNLNPCHHLFFGVVEPEPNSPGARFEASCADLKQLLPLAWSHDPLTTLKLIRNLMVPYHTDNGDQKFNKAFYLSMNWLHQNHPKTFISNLAPFTEVYGNFFFLAKMLCFLLEGQKFLERYEHDPDYKLLYDSVCDFFVENLECDIEKLKRQKLKHPDINPGMDNLFGRNISMAGNSFFDYDMRPISMFQSIAVKLFPRESDPEFQGLEEADYKGRVWSQFYEVLGPLARASDTQYEYRDPIEPPAHKTYLERLKADKSKLRADALLPNQIIALCAPLGFREGG